MFDLPEPETEAADVDFPEAEVDFDEPPELEAVDLEPPADLDVFGPDAEDGEGEEFENKRIESPAVEEFPETAASPAFEPPVEEPETAAEQVPAIPEEPDAVVLQEPEERVAAPEPAPVDVAPPGEEPVKVEPAKIGPTTTGPGIQAEPAKAKPKRKARLGGLDALAELEKLRHQAMRPTLGAGTREVRHKQAFPISPENLHPARRLHLRLELRDQEGRPLGEGQDLDLDLDEMQGAEKLLLRLQLALKTNG